MTTVGSGKYTYELIQDWPKLPPGEVLGVVSSVASDSQDRIYAFQRQDPPVMVFDRDGNYLDRCDYRTSQDLLEQRSEGYFYRMVDSGQDNF